MQIRNVSIADLSVVRKFVSKCPPLTPHTAVTYGILFHLFPELCFVAEEAGIVVAFASAMRGTNNHESVYCWQLGVAPQFRETGLATRLVKARIDAARALGCVRLQVGIVPTNVPSLRLWSKYAASSGHELRKAGKIDFVDELSGNSEFDVVWEFNL